MASLPEGEVITSESGGQAPKRRVDPPPRPLDGVLSQAALFNRDPNKHYVLVSKVADETHGIGTYLMTGYKIERADKSNPEQVRPAMSWQEFNDGDPIETASSILMSCPLEHKKMLDRMGQERVEAIERTIKRRDIPGLNMSPQEQADYRNIRFEPHGEDNRPQWQY